MVLSAKCGRTQWCAGASPATSASASLAGCGRNGGAPKQRHERSTGGGGATGFVASAAAAFLFARFLPSCREKKETGTKKRSEDPSQKLPG